MTEKTSDQLIAAHSRMLDWCAENGGVPKGYTEDATAEIDFWASVERHTSAEFAAGMFTQWQDTKRAGGEESAADHALQHAALCGNHGPAEICGCRLVTSVHADQVLPIDPLAIMGMARERVLAHGGSFLETVRDLVDAHVTLRKAVIADSLRPQK